MTSTSDASEARRLAEEAKRLVHAYAEDAFTEWSEVEIAIDRLATLTPVGASETEGEQKAFAPVAAAMKVVTQAMRDDPEYAWGWHCNIAMAFVDAGGDHVIGNQGAARFLRMLANVEPAHPLPCAAPAPQADPTAILTASVDEHLGWPKRPKAVGRLAVPFAGECDVYTWEQVQGCILWDRKHRAAPQVQSGQADDARDSARYRWLRDTLHAAVGGGVEVNDQRLVYEQPEPGEVVRVFWYPDTPVGFYESKADTLDTAIDAAMQAPERDSPNQPKGEQS